MRQPASLCEAAEPSPVSVERCLLPTLVRGSCCRASRELSAGARNFHAPNSGHLQVPTRLVGSGHVSRTPFGTPAILIVEGRALSPVQLSKRAASWRDVASSLVRMAETWELAVR